MHFFPDTDVISHHAYDMLLGSLTIFGYRVREEDNVATEHQILR